MFSAKLIRSENFVDQVPKSEDDTSEWGVSEGELAPELKPRSFSPVAAVEHRNIEEIRQIERQRNA